MRRDVAKYVRTSDYDVLNQAAAGLAQSQLPTLVLWASQDRVMPAEHGRRLAEQIPNARYLELDDAYSLLPLYRPHDVATHIAAFASSLDPRSANQSPGSAAPR